MQSVIAKFYHLCYNIYMTHTHPSHNPEGQESSIHHVEHAHAEHRTKSMQEGNHHDVFAVVGDSVDSSASPTDALYSVPAAPTRSSVAREENEAYGDVQQRLDDLEDLASDLVQKSTEHRVEDFRDRLPIFSNIRSHKLATREGEVMQQMKTDLVGLKQSIAASGMQIDITALEKMIDDLSVPGGITKAFATLIPGIRTFHRGVVVTRFEDLKKATGFLKRQVRDMKVSKRLSA
jgi:hypothetical protein